MTLTSRKRLKGLAAVALVAALGVVGPQIWGPAQKAEAFPVDALSFGSNSHGAMTRAAVRQFLRDVYGITTPTAAQEQAATEVGIGNELVDGDQIKSAKHFDGENFTDGKAEITANLTAAVTQAQIDVPGFARTSVGAALHTIQDFYAHSNWVELGNITINPNLYNNLSIGTIAGPFEVTCDFLDGGKLITNKLTSGYYGGEDRVAKIAGKCRHGGPTDLSAGSGGMNKDFNFLAFSPHAGFHGTASDLAIKASVQFLKDYRLTVGNEAKTKKVFNVS